MNNNKLLYRDKKGYSVFVSDKGLRIYDGKGFNLTGYSEQNYIKDNEKTINNSYEKFLMNQRRKL